MTPKEELSYLFDEIYKLTDTLYETMNHMTEYSECENGHMKIKTMNFNDITYDLEENYKKVIELCCNTYY